MLTSVVRPRERKKKSISGKQQRHIDGIWRLYFSSGLIVVLFVLSLDSLNSRKRNRCFVNKRSATDRAGDDADDDDDDDDDDDADDDEDDDDDGDDDDDEGEKARHV